MPDIKTVTIQKINRGLAYQRKYHVEYYSGVRRIYGIPPDTVLKFVEENRREFQKVKYTFTDETEVNND